MRIINLLQRRVKVSAVNFFSLTPPLSPYIPNPRGAPHVIIFMYNVFLAFVT